MTIWAIWIQWKWIRCVNGKLNLKVICIVRHALWMHSSIRIHLNSELTQFFCFFLFLLPISVCRRSTTTEKYDYVGRLLRPGEKPTNYSDEEDESESSKAGNKSDDIVNVSATDESTPKANKKDDWRWYQCLRLPPIRIAHREWGEWWNIGVRGDEETDKTISRHKVRRQSKELDSGWMMMKNGRNYVKKRREKVTGSKIVE